MRQELWRQGQNESPCQNRPSKFEALQVSNLRKILQGKGDFDKTRIQRTWGWTVKAIQMRCLRVWICIQ